MVHLWVTFGLLLGHRWVTVGCNGGLCGALRYLWASLRTLGGAEGAFWIRRRVEHETEVNIKCIKTKQASVCMRLENIYKRPRSIK